MQPAPYQVLVDWKDINIPSGVVRVTRNYPNSWTSYRDDTLISWDLKPAHMEMVPHTLVLQRVQFELPSIRLSDAETYMWIDYNGTQPLIGILEERGEQFGFYAAYRVMGTRLVCAGILGRTAL